MSILKRIALLAFFGALISLYTLYHHTEVTGGYLTGKSFCSFGETFDCDTVAKSAYSRFLGIPVAAWSFMYYSLVVVIAHWAANKDRENDIENRAAVFFLICLSIPPSVALGLVSQFIIQKLCLLCCMLYVVNLLLFIVGWQVNKGPASESVKRSAFSAFVLGARSFTRIFFDYSGPTFIGSAGGRLCLAAVCGLTLGAGLPRLLTNFYFEPRAASLLSRETLEPIYQEWLKAPVENIPVATNASSAERDFAKGKDNSLVTVVEFADFECPYCKRTANYLEDLLSKDGTDIQLIYKAFPLDQLCNARLKKKVHEFSCRAAVLARCAGLESDAAFWAVHNEFVDLVDFSELTLSDVLVQAKVNIPSVEACEASGAALARVKQDVELGTRLQIASTPTLFINGKRVVVRPDYVPGLLKLIRFELRRQTAEQSP